MEFLAYSLDVYLVLWRAPVSNGLNWLLPEWMPLLILPEILFLWFTMFLAGCFALVLDDDPPDSGGAAIAQIIAAAFVVPVVFMLGAVSGRWAFESQTDQILFGWALLLGLMFTLLYLTYAFEVPEGSALAQLIGSV